MFRCQDVIFESRPKFSKTSVPDEKSDKSFKEMMEEQEEAVEGRDSLGKLGGCPTLSPQSKRRNRPHLQTIISQKIMQFDSDESDEE